MERFQSLPAITFAVQLDDQREQVSGELTEFPPQIENLGVDSAGNIWAQRGTSSGFFWDVYSPQGELVRQVTLTSLPDTAMVRIHVNRHGIVAWDLAPEDYPKVYLLSFKEGI
jgi:sugar lactone lactonase YvrE